MSNSPKFNDNADEPDHPAMELEVVEPSALEAISRAEVDVQIATAHRFPRSLARFQKRALEMATLDEETAESCLYKLTRKDKNSPGGTKIIEGESIRFAEIVAASYGNMRIAAQITAQTPVKVTVRAVAHDLESNVLFAQEKQARTTYKNGDPYSDDMAIIIANATISKAVRDAIFRVVPKAMVKGIKEQVRRVAIGTTATLESRRSKAMQWVQSLKIDTARVFAVLGVKGEPEIGLEALEVLTGLRTAIREGDQTVDDAFPAVQTPGTPPSFGPADDGSGAQGGSGDTGPAGTGPAASPQSGQPATQAPKRRGRPPKVDPEPPTSGPDPVTQPPSEPAPEPAPQPSLREVVSAFLDEQRIPFDDFRDWLQNSGIKNDASAFGSVDDLPEDVLKVVTEDGNRLLKRCATIYGS